MSAATVTSHRRRFTGQSAGRRTTGWVVVAVVHVLIAWLLISGTARKGLELIKKPLEAAVIEEVIIPPPPPPPPKQIVKQPEQIKTDVPPPHFVPPPDVAPPQTSTAPVVQSVATPPVAPPVIAPPPPPAPPPAPPRPAGPVSMGVACPTQVKPEMPRRALREGVEGVVRAQATIVGGAVKDVQILSGPRLFHDAVREAMMQYKCAVTSEQVIAVQEFAFKLD